jgi:hypothetical protein
MRRKLRFMEQGVFVSAHQHCSQVLGGQNAIFFNDIMSLRLLLRPCLTVQGSIQIKADEYLLLVTALQHNKTLKSLDLRCRKYLVLTHEEDKQMAALLKKNYALENLPAIDPDNRLGDGGAILRLNEAGRRYLIEDGSSISKGVKVSSAVRSDINCVFLHLLENPTLCDRSAVEASSGSTCTDNGGSTSPVNHIAKREHGRAQNEVKEGRRRLT